MPRRAGLKPGHYKARAEDAALPSGAVKASALGCGAFGREAIACAIGPSVDDERAVFANDAMTRHDDGDGLVAQARAVGANRLSEAQT